MMLLIAALGFALVAALAGAPAAEGKAPAEASRWGIKFRAAMVLDAKPGCWDCPKGTQRARGFVHLNDKKPRRASGLAEVRVTTWKRLPHQRAVRYDRGTWRNVRSSAASGSKWVEDFATREHAPCSEPLGTKYFTKVRVKVAGEPALWLRSRTRTVGAEWVPWCTIGGESVGSPAG